MTAALVLLALAAQEDLFNGEDFRGWIFRSKGGDRGKWTVGEAGLDPADPARLAAAEKGADLVNAGEGKGVDLYTELVHADCVLEAEVMVARGAESGLFFMGEYELRLRDSHGVEKPGTGDMGAVAGVAAPRLNASKPAGEWQKLVVDFRAPKFDRSGRKTHDAAFLRVELNGRVILRDADVGKPMAGGLTGREVSKGPLMLQGGRGPVAFRKLRIFGASK